MHGAVNPDAQRISATMSSLLLTSGSENDPRLVARVKAASGKTLLIFDQRMRRRRGPDPGELQANTATCQWSDSKCCACRASAGVGGLSRKAVYVGAEALAGESTMF